MLVSPLWTLTRLTSSTSTQSTPSRCMPSGGGAERGEAAAAITPAIGHVGIDAKIVPAAGEGIPIAQPHRLQHAAHFGRVDIGEPVAGDGLGDVGEAVSHALDVRAQ